MTYVGQQPATTFDSGIQDRFTGLTTNTVTLNHEISAEEDILVVWNNIVQDKNTYSVGGTGNKTVTLGGTLVSGDVVTVYYLNKVMQSVNPTAGSVTSTTITDDIISGQTAITSVADTDELLVSDAGVLKRVDYSHLKSSGKIGAVTISPNITTGQASTTSTSYADSGTTVISLTPSATSSKIWVSYTFNLDAGGDGQGVSSAIYADINGAGYNNIDATGQFTGDYNDLGNGTRLRQWVTLNSLYSPSTTSVVNFKLYWKTSAGTAYLNMKTVKIVLLEVLA